MTEDDVQILEKTAAYEGTFRIDRYRFKHRLHDGGWSGEIAREVFDRGHVAAVLLYDPARDSVVLIEQFRIGALASTARFKKRGPWLIEAVAGVIEAGESAEDMVRREAAEEAGLEPSDLIPMLDYLSSPGCMSESVALYCGRVDASAAGGVHGLDHEHEDIRVLVVPFRQAVGMVESGRIFDAHTIIALYWLALNRDRVRRRWS